MAGPPAHASGRIGGGGQSTGLERRSEITGTEVVRVFRLHPQGSQPMPEPDANPVRRATGGMMQEQEGSSRAGDTWRETTSRALALLAPFSQVRLTLRLPPDAFDSTLYRNFPLRDDERLLAVIDCGKGNPDGFCALTTHRIYWPAGEAGSGGASRTGPVPPGGEDDRFATVSVTASATMAGSGAGAAGDANRPANGHAPDCRWVDYVAIPGDLGRTGASAGVGPARPGRRPDPRAARGGSAVDSRPGALPDDHGGRAARSGSRRGRRGSVSRPRGRRPACRPLPRSVAGSPRPICSNSAARSTPRRASWS